MSTEQPNPDVKYTKEDILPPWVKIERIMANYKEPFFVAITRTFDWDKAPFARNTSLPSHQVPTLIKYSKAKFSPVSSFAAKDIQVVCPSFYRDLAPDDNSQLIADELDSVIRETLNWRKKGSEPIEILKKGLRGSLPGIEYADTSTALTFTTRGSWIYCTSIDPSTNLKRRMQKEHLSLNYDFMTRIDNPSSFATQLGGDIGQQVSFKNDFICDYPVFFRMVIPGSKNVIENIIKNMLTIEVISQCTKDTLRDALVQLKATTTVHTIFVDHGPVLYLERDRFTSYKAELPELHGASVVPFVKQIDYAEQQEYRFVISAQFHTPRNAKFNLAVSDELRTLMTPLGAAP